MKNAFYFILKPLFVLKIFKFLSWHFGQVEETTWLERQGLSDCNRTRTHNHLVRKRTLNHLAKLAKWLRCVVSTNLYGAFDRMFLSCHVRISECIHTLYLPECQELLARNRRDIWSLSREVKAGKLWNSAK